MGQFKDITHSIGSALRYNNKKQAFSHACYALRTLYYRTPLYPLLEDPISAPTSLLLTPPKLWRGQQKVGKAIAEGNSFTFVGQEVKMDEGIQWRPQGVSTSWVHHLHGFEYLSDLREYAPSGAEKAVELIEDWLAHCNHFHMGIWDGVPLSRRIVSWLTHYSWLEDHMSAQTKINMRLSIARQVEHLSRNIQWHVGGLPVILNLKALTYAGLCVPSHQTAYLDALSLLQDELKKQVHHDGFHASRTPSAHFAVLKELVDIQAMVRKAGQVPPAFLNETVDRMAAAHQFLLHPDGKCALFNHAEEGDATFMARVVDRCDPQQLFQNHMPDSGFIRLTGGDAHLFIDAGVPNTKTLYGDQHSEVSSFELSIGAERLFVNCGGFRRQHPRAKMYRTSAAHNTVTVNGEDAVQLLSHGRIGRAPTTVSAKVSHEEGMGSGVSITHDGFYALNKTAAARTFFLSAKGDLIGEDQLSSTQAFSVHAYFNLHPSVTCHLISHEEAHLTLKSGAVYQFRVKGGALQEAEGFYAGRYGQEVSNKRLILRAQSRHNNCTLKWALKKVAPNA